MSSEAPARACVCIQYMTSYVTLRAAGYELANDRVTCVDVNECQQQADTCSHLCINTSPGFRCACPAGYELLADERTCQGQYKLQHPSLYNEP